MLMVRGDLVKFDLDDGRVVEVPEDFGLVHDPAGEVIDRCDMLVVSYRLTSRRRVPVQTGIAELAKDYFGDSKAVLSGSVAIPKGPWQPLGVVATVYYARYGHKQGLYYHPFEDRVELFKQARGKALLLRMPDKCVVNERGFVWP